MKKYVSFGAFALILMLAFASCKKHGHGKTTYQTIDVNLDENKSYQYTFTAHMHDLEITKQAQSFLVSEIDKSSEMSLFNYMPKLNQAGNDSVEITVYEKNENHAHCGHHPHPGGGACQHQQGGHNECHHHCDGDDKTIYTFNFTIQKTVAGTKQIPVAESK